EGRITVDTDKLIVEKDSEFDYESDDLEGFNPHGFCQAPAILENNPILDYRFDECSYTGGPDEVIAQTGNYNADSYNVIDPVNDAVINNSLDLRPLNVVRVTPNWLQVPKNAINGLDDFTVAFWVKAPKSDVSGKTRQQVLHALGNSTSDNQLGIYLRNSDQVVIEVQNESETLDSGTTLTNDTWYHLTLTRQDEDVCLFVNGVSKDCV
ncbi:MAG: LamG domain-containing protein, partial [Alteromonadales bacterium]|nr:LamG domain-containing protein [Alteromonadales bacterium]